MLSTCLEQTNISTRIQNEGSTPYSIPKKPDVIYKLDEKKTMAKTPERLMPCGFDRMASIFT
ncbi:MAG TPA: hypothetical protein VHP38_06860 [Ruminiclostridium sp.]|nr:hypothetical protein [Ruminiclostridium sp.]